VAGFGGEFLFAPTVVGISDHFATHNQFWGGTVGAQGEVRFGNYFLNGVGKLGVGETHETTIIKGFTASSQDGVLREVPGGLAAMALNSGRHTEDQFAIVPQVDVNFGFFFSPSVRLWVGYSFLYWSNVIRPGDQAATPVTPSLVPTSLQFNPSATPPRSFPVLSRTDYFAQGITFGIAIRY